MEYYDEQILEARWEEERRKHTTLETGIYVEDDLEVLCGGYMEEPETVCYINTKEGRYER